MHYSSQKLDYTTLCKSFSRWTVYALLILEKQIYYGKRSAHSRSIINPSFVSYLSNRTQESYLTLSARNSISFNKVHSCIKLGY